MNDLRVLVVFWKHMRVPFQLTLAPLFLWGVFLSGAGLSLEVAVAFVSLHLCLYPGVTAFNTSYDRDTGPVSGMMEPPKVPSGLITFSIVLQIAGALLAAVVNLSFLAAYCTIAVLAMCYSHPRIRWKARPWASAATVAIGQGVLGYLAGWSAASGELPLPPSYPALLGAIVAGLTTLGLYPSTQVFQVEEDEARGDRTLAVTLGPARALRLGSLCLLGAGATATWLVFRELRALDALLIACAFAGVLAHNELFARKIAGNALNLRQTYRWAMRTSTVSTVGFLLFITFEMARM